MTKIQVWLNVFGNADGGVQINWFLTEVDAHIDNRNSEDNDYGLPDDSIEMIETYVDSNIHKEAIKNSLELSREYEEEILNTIIRTPFGDRKYQR